MNYNLSEPQHYYPSWIPFDHYIENCMWWHICYYQHFFFHIFTMVKYYRRWDVTMDVISYPIVNNKGWLNIQSHKRPSLRSTMWTKFCLYSTSLFRLLYCEENCFPEHMILRDSCTQNMLGQIHIRFQTRGIQVTSQINNPCKMMQKASRLERICHNMLDRAYAALEYALHSAA